MESPFFKHLHSVKHHFNYSLCVILKFDEFCQKMAQHNSFVITLLPPHMVNNLEMGP